LHDKGVVDREAAAVAKVMENDAMEGPGIEQALAVARAQLGERDAALKHVSHVLQIYGEGSLTRALLRLDPLWDPLRSDPRIRKLVQP
jgi:serine/threonine-protein kinase